jgi:multidrug resistance efflux pump
MPEPYTLALSKARAELEAANQEVKAANLRISQLEAVIAQLEALIASAKPVPMSLSFFEERPEHGDILPANKVLGPPVPLWKAIVSALNGKKADFTVPDACAALDRTGRFINSPNKKSIVRNALKQKPEMFVKLPEMGHYRVRGFEEKTEEGRKIA